MGFLPRPIDLVNMSVGLAGVKVARGIAYGDNPRQVMDIYSPPGRNLPVIVFYYGGSWQEGERADYAFVAGLFAARGFVAVLPDYRVYPETRYPGFVEDCDTAAHWVAENIEVFGGSPRAIFLMGHSAGAYNAVMVALGNAAPPLAGIIGLAGPYDFLPLKDPIIQTIFSGPHELADTQPVNHVHGAAPPMFLATGARDRTVLPRNTTALAAKLRRAGAAVETRIYPKLAHISILAALLPYFAWRGRVMRDVLTFCLACLEGEYREASADVGMPMERRSL